MQCILYTSPKEEMRPVKYHNKIKLLYWPPCWCSGSRTGPSKIKEIYFFGKKKKNQVCMPGLVISYKDIPTPSLPLMILSFFSLIFDYVASSSSPIQMAYEFSAACRRAKGLLCSICLFGGGLFPHIVLAYTR